MIRMRQIKRIFIIMIMAAFTLNAVAATAMAACNCPDMSAEAKQEMNSDMPCHGMDKAEAEQTSDDDSKQANCDKCGCGHCKVPSQTSLLNNPAASPVMTSSDMHLPTSDILISNIAFGIDNPPKHIS